MITAFTSYCKESWNELKTVSWPHKKQVASDTAMVIIVSLVAAIVLGALDFGLQALLRASLTLSQ